MHNAIIGNRSETTTASTLTDRDISLTKCWNTHNIYILGCLSVLSSFIIRRRFSLWLLLLWLCVVAWCFARCSYLSRSLLLSWAGFSPSIISPIFYSRLLSWLAPLTCRNLGTPFVVRIRRRVLGDTPGRTDWAQCPSDRP